MSANIYLNLLIFCSIFCQGITGSFLEEKESSDLLVRKKRIVNYGPNANSPLDPKEYGYILSIKENRKEHHCAGAILSFRFIITAAKCVVLPVTEYRVIAGTFELIYTRTVHNITEKYLRLANDPHRPTDGIALATVYPTFQFDQYLHSIGLHGIPVRPRTLATVAGWRCTTHEHQPVRKEGVRLASITVPIISNQECANAYREFFPITEKDICTHDITHGQQFCGITDQGSPLVIQVRGGRSQLLGINLWGGSLVGYSRPDIFVNMQHPYYLNWIGLHV